MKNFKNIGVTLSRNEMRGVQGGLADGRACSHSIQGSNGLWVTRSGTCASHLIFGGDGQFPIAVKYCETGLGYVSVTSNGGSSRC